MRVLHISVIKWGGMFTLLLLGSCFLSADERTKYVHVTTEDVSPNPEPPLDSLTIFFVGDVMQHIPQIHAAWNPEMNLYDYTPCFQYIAPIWRTMDYVVANLETTLADANYSGYPHFVSPKSLVADMQKAGVNVMITANNHSCDNGLDGIVTTIQTLDSLGIAHTGTFNTDERTPVYIKKGNLKVAILNYTYGVNGMPIPKGTHVNMIDTSLIKEDILQLKNKEITHIITCLHWGIEYETSPNAEQKFLSEWCHRQGVFAVIGFHPHVVQPIELIYDSLEGNIIHITAYSLGNFISNQRKRHTDGGLNICLTIRENKTTPIGKDTNKNTSSPLYSYSIKRLSNWVWVPTIDSKKQYYVIPEYMIHHVLDSTFVSDIQSASLFYADTDSILGNRVPKMTN